MSDLVRLQAHWCGTLGSPFYAGLLERAADDVAAGGPAWAVLDGYESLPPSDVVPLRLMGGIHRQVLEDRAPALARFFPSVGGTGDVEATWPVLHRFLEEHRDEIRPFLERGVQTNEVARSAALLGGFLLLGRENEKPLRLLEVGASAGLNLRWDQYRYETRNGSWGEPDSPVVMRDWLDRGDPFMEGHVGVSERRGCDLNPIDPTTEDGRLTLMSYVWPDQTERFTLLRNALDIAPRIPITVDAESASLWLRARLADPEPGIVSVVFHSIVIQYMSEAERDGVAWALEEAGNRASADAPLAWLRLEPGGEQAEIRLTTWPGGKERLLASCSFHGRNVCWRQ